MPVRTLRRQILLSTTMIVGALTGYASRAYAQAAGGACTGGGGTYMCSGNYGVPQSITADDAQVTVTVPGLIVDTTGGTPGIALTITGAGAISFTDSYSAPYSSLTAGTGYDALSITSTGDIVSGNDGSVTVNTSGALTGDNDGIDAENYGSGYLSIVANGEVTGTNHDGIFAENNAGTNVSVTTGAAVAGGYHGIYAKNHGTGSTVVTANGDVTGSTGYGIYAGNTDTGSTYISVTTAAATTVTGDYAGISVKNYGTGNTTVKAYGAVTGTDYGINARNQSTTSGDLVVKTGSGAIYGANYYGIYANNQSTTGATTITVGGDVTGHLRSGIKARTYGAGVTITTAAGSAVTGGGHGIAAYNNTGGTGAISISVGANGTVTGTTGWGIKAYGAVNNTNVIVTTGAGSTVSGGGTNGIYALNHGSGYTTVTAYGDVTGTTRGIYARNFSGTTDLTVTTGTGTITGATDGIYARNQSTGRNTTVTANGTVTGTTNHGIDVRGSGSVDVITGAYSSITGSYAGVFAQNLGSGPLNVTINGAVNGDTGVQTAANSGTDTTVTIGASAQVTGASFGINSSNDGSGALRVEVYGYVNSSSKANSRGINANTYGTNLDIVTGAGSTVKGDGYGIDAINSGYGHLSVTADGDVTGSNYRGIHAVNFSGTSLTVTTGAGTTVSGGNEGIVAAQYTSGSLTITTSGNVTGENNDGIYITNTGGNTANITVNAGSSVTSNGGGAGDFTIDVNSGAANVTVAGTLNGGAGGAVQFANATNTLELVTGATVTGNVIGGTGTDTLTLSGANTGTFDVGQLQNFETGAKKDAGTWTLTGTNTGITAFAVDAGTLSVNGSLANAAFTVNGGTLKGTGTLGALAVNGGTLAPGNSIGTMYVNGAFTLGSGAVYEVEANAQGESDKVVVKGTVNLTGSVLHVLAANGNYKTKTDYTIIDNDGSDAVVGAFSSITSSLAFLTPTVVYNGGTGNDVVLTLARNDTLFPDVARTRNQRAVAGALSQFSTSNALYLAVLNQTAEGARTAFDALSGEIHATAAGVILDDNRYVREAILGRLVQATYTNNAGELGSLAASGPQVASLDSQAMALGYARDDKDLSAPAPSPLAFWTRAYGAWGNFNGDGNAATANRNLGGFVSGMDAAIGDSWRAGLATGASFSNVDVDARYSSAQVDSYHLGGYLGGMAGPLALRGGGMWAWSAIDTSRAVVFPGFFERQKASYNADTGQIFGEVAYPTKIWGAGVEPFAGLAYVSESSDTFHENGGALARLRGSTDQNVGYTTVGLRAAQTMQWAGMTITPNGSVAWLHAFSGVTPDAGLAFSSTGIGFTVYGVPLAQDSALLDAGLDLTLGPRTTAGVSYSGQYGDGVTDNAVKGRFTWLF